MSLLVSSVWLASKTSRMVEYMEKKRMWRDFPDLNFGGPFTTVSVTEGVSDIAHTDRNDAGLTWVVPMGKWEGGDLCIPFYKIKIPIKEGEAIAFQANFMAHMSSPMESGYRLALTCFTDKNIMVDSQEYWEKVNKRQLK